jgi:hypothetical protein
VTSPADRFGSVSSAGGSNEARFFIPEDPFLEIMVVESWNILHADAAVPEFKETGKKDT